MRRGQTGWPTQVVDFAELIEALEAVVNLLPGERAWILIDEWSELPWEVQPYVADFIRRWSSACRNVTIKIAAVQHRSTFRTRTPAGGQIGLELGADMPIFSLDQYLNAPVRTAGNAPAFFVELLQRHVEGTGGRDEDPQWPSSADFRATAFNGEKAVEAFVAAAEGVPRDALAIASLAAELAGAGPISEEGVVEAARTWSRRDKASAVVGHSADLVSFLDWLMERVADVTDSRYFLVQRIDRDNYRLKLLYDLRLLHLDREGVAVSASPGTAYDRWRLDLGAYWDRRDVDTYPAPSRPNDRDCPVIDPFTYDAYTRTETNFMATAPVSIDAILVEEKNRKLRGTLTERLLPATASLAAGDYLIVEAADGIYAVPVRDQMRLGRGVHADLRLDSPSVSRHHATISAEGSIWVVNDEGSLNGTLLNSVRVNSANLSPGDIITVGGRHVLFVRIENQDGEFT